MGSFGGFYKGEKKKQKKGKEQKQQGMGIGMGSQPIVLPEIISRKKPTA